MRSRTFLIAALIIVLAGAGWYALRPKPNTFTAQGLQWTEFSWVGDQFFEKGALVVPLTIDGQTDGNLWMQLDTGIYTSRVYELPFKHVNQQAYRVIKKDGTRPFAVQFSGSVGDLPVERAQAAIMRNFGTPVEKLEGDIILGSIGLDMFMGKVLVIDFPNERLAVVGSVAELPESLTEEEFIPAKIRNNWFGVEAKSGDRSLTLVYDTGSSSTPLYVERPLWDELTGKSIYSPDLPRYEGSSWGRTLTFVGAPLQGDLLLGATTFSQPEVFCIESEEVSLLQGLVDGIMGNALFYDEYTVILDIKNPRHPRFGFIKTR